MTMNARTVIEYLFFYSDQGAEILKASESAGCDGTFKYSPKIFYQIFTIIGIYKGDSFI